MSKGPRRFPVVKIVRMSKEDARVLRHYADVWKCSESEAMRRLIRKKAA